MPKIPQIPFAFELKYNQLNGNSVGFGNFSKIDGIAIQWTTNLPNYHSAEYTQTETQKEPVLFRMHLITSSSGKEKMLRSHYPESAAGSQSEFYHCF